ncbi:hypothetical protein Zmor_023430 [Zophobas morio]|uniref:lysozyme n=1 Tax=Zophobas morio TaxID=2755281 RepID=A0AA38HYB1_9CUCU|nr:hypothetical protein Zmor_023430 [Zophobas morio]
MNIFVTFVFVVIFVTSCKGIKSYMGTDMQTCFNCLCHARTGCYSRINCAKYSINFDYWKTANSPVVDVDDEPETQQSYKKCMRNENCILATLDQYADAIGHMTTDPWYSDLLDKVANRPASCPSFRVENSRLYKYGKNSLPELRKESDYWKLVVPKDFGLGIFKRHHEIPASGHVGIFKTYWKIRHRYFWPKMQADVVKFVNGCVTCARYKTERKAPAGLMGGKPSITAPWQLVSLDFIGPFARATQGYTHVLVATDHFTKEHQLYGHDADHDLSDEPENLGDTVRKRQEGYKRMYQDIVGKLAKDFARNKMTYDLRRKPVYYVLGPKFVGPFVITRKCGARTYELADKQGIKSRVWHAQDLKPVNDTFIALSAGPEDYRNRVSP